MVFGYIYKITNDINGKFYIGQSKNDVKYRFQRHIKDSIGERHLDTHFARAIRHYGPEHFHIEVIDTAENQEELTLKEYDWIEKTDACHKGYNESNAKFKCGGNTYLSKTTDEMEDIKSKISLANGGGNNGNARKIKVKNIKTEQELFFDSVAEAQEYFNLNDHSRITKRCRHECKKLLCDEWKCAYIEDDYDEIKIPLKKLGYSVGKRKISVYDMVLKTTNIYDSYRDFERKCGLKYKSVAVKCTYKKGDKFIFKERYEITLLN